MSPDISSSERREVSEMLREVEEAESAYRRDLSKLQDETKCMGTKLCNVMVKVA